MVLNKLKHAGVAKHLPCNFQSSGYIGTGTSQLGRRSGLCTTFSQENNKLFSFTRNHTSTIKATCIVYHFIGKVPKKKGRFMRPFLLLLRCLLRFVESHPRLIQRLALLADIVTDVDRHAEGDAVTWMAQPQRLLSGLIAKVVRVCVLVVANQ